MARREVDREDLLREATGLVERIEFRVDGFDDPIVAGFRRSGCGSLYFGADPVVQFNTAGALRRGYRRGRLLKAEAGRLVELERERTETSTTLVARELSDAESAEVLAEFATAIDRLRAALAERRYEIVGQAPPERDVASRVVRWLAGLASPPPIAERPHAE